MAGKLKHIINENLSGILGTLAFHMLVVIIFLIIKISSTRSLMDSFILVDFEDDEKTEQEIIEKEIELDPDFEQYVADYLDAARRNIPVNVADRLNEELSTEKYVEELLDEMNDDRSEDYQRSNERLQELLEMEEGEDIIVEGEQDEEDSEPEIYQGPTNIYFSLENRYEVRLPVPVYKCEGEGIVEVQVAVDQRGRVVQVSVDNLGDSLNEICLAEAARTAALNTRFNSDFEAPVRQQGTITYHFQPQ
ncbi:MAG: hypothetical protein ISS19_15680 [Bacteroidales bacterium]|nr:hypothetical protein [Bacteroidales bacterium]